MFVKQSRLERKQAACAHAERISGTAHGIRREVCKDCGHVSVSHENETITQEFDTTRI